MASYETESVEVQVPGGLWIVWVVLGFISTVLGIWLIFNNDAARYTLAIVLAIGLFFSGIGEIAFARDRPRPWVGYAVGAVFVLAAIAVVINPDIGLSALALVVGISLLVVGIFQFAAAIMDRDSIRHWAFLAFLGAVTFVAGFLALVWPSATVAVLALIIGIRLTMYGLTQIVLGVNLRKLTS
jgi:uncharacterized membrane protein HdeD (DUF308 family)